MHDIFSTNTTKLSFDESLHVEPGFKLSTGIAEAMLELQEMDMQLFKEMLAHDYKELEYQQKGFNESAIEALHEGMWETIKEKVAAMWDWFITKITSVWNCISTFVNKVIDSVMELISSLLGLDKDDDEKEPEAKKEKKNAFDVKITWFDKFDPRAAIDMLLKIQPFNDYLGWFGRNKFEPDKEKEMLDQSTVPMGKIYTQFKESDLFKTREISAKDVKELNSARAIKATAELVKPLANKSRDYCNKLTGGKEKVLNFIKNNDEKLSVGVAHALRTYVSRILEITKIMRNYFNTICKALYTIQAHIRHRIVDKKNMPSMVMSQDEFDSWVKKSGDSVKKLDPSFVKEAVEFDYDEMLENCYIDSVGKVVCNF